MNKVLLCLLLMFSSVAIASDKDEDSIEGAGVNALKEAFNSPSGQLWEYGGIIVLHDAHYRWTTPVTNQRDDGVIIDPSVLLQKGDIFVGLYHSHPCRSLTHFSWFYSVPDTYQIYWYKRPSFILDECSGNVHMFDPARDNPKDTGADVQIIDTILKDGLLVPDPNSVLHTVHLTSGRIIGNIGQIGPDLDYDEQ